MAQQGPHRDVVSEAQHLDWPVPGGRLSLRDARLWSREIAQGARASGAWQKGEHHGVRVMWQRAARGLDVLQRVRSSSSGRGRRRVGARCCGANHGPVLDLCACGVACRCQKRSCEVDCGSACRTAPHRGRRCRDVEGILGQCRCRRRCTRAGGKDGGHRAC